MLEPIEENNQEAISIQNELSFWDFLQVISQPHHPLRNIAFTAIFGAILGLFSALDRPSFEWKIATIAYWSFIMPVFLTVVLYMQFKRSKNNLQSLITVSRDAINVTTSQGTKAVYSWHTVSRVERKKSAVLIQVMTKPNAYLWMPIRRFASEEDATRLVNQANQFWSQWLLTEKPEITEEPDPDPAHLSVDADITLGELVVCDMHLRKTVVIVGLVLLVITLAMIAVCTALSPHTPLSPFFIIASILGSLYFVCLPAINAFYKFKKWSTLLAGRTTISPTALRPHNRVAGIDQSIDWKSIKRVYVAHNLLFFETEKRSGIVVPLRCFETAEAAKTFEESALGWWQAAHANDEPKLPGKTKT